MDLTKGNFDDKHVGKAHHTWARATVDMSVTGGPGTTRRLHFLKLCFRRDQVKYCTNRRRYVPNPDARTKTVPDCCGNL
jgi:hypothetical protein